MSLWWLYRQNPGLIRRIRPAFCWKLIASQYRVSATPVALMLSVSLGSSSFPGDDKDFSLLLANADAAMYNAKALGRRRWVAYSADMQP